MAEQTQTLQQQQQQQPPRPYVPSRTLDTRFPLIDNDPHIKRVLAYSRWSDWARAAGVALGAPGLMLVWERFAPSYASKTSFRSAMRLTWATGITGGFLLMAKGSSARLYGLIENQAEVDRDMREMVDKVKRGEPLYGISQLSPYMQGVASRNSRYSTLLIHLIPWFNFVNHDQHGVDTSKYYQQAERELEAERAAGNRSS